jgi:predicted extracellular nuclease
MNLPRKILLFLALFFPELLFSQDGDFKIMFYNVENLFDTFNDSLKNDEEFLPHGERNWTYKRFEQKLNNISKVVIAAGKWEPPAIVGMCEVENRYVVEQLLRTPLLEKINYRIIHKESPDERGIDVSLIYDAQRFVPVKYEYYPLVGKDSQVVSTREILHVAGVVKGTGDTINIFVNHWPSRYGGLLETVGMRDLAAQTLIDALANVVSENPDAKIIIVGDFNDQPGDASIKKLIEASGKWNPGKSKLVNLSDNWQTINSGTIKFQSQWLVYDQIIVSENLLDSTNNVFCKSGGANILQNGFLLEKDKKIGGTKPFRTYSGFKYQGGFSDHLPVVLNLIFWRF